MQPSEFDEPANELDRRLFHILSHGQKEQKEFVRLLSTARFSEKSIRSSVRGLSEKYRWAVEVDEEGTTYYYRKDIGRQPIQPKINANNKDIDNILENVELQLGLEARNRGYTKTTPTLLESFNQLSKEAQKKQKLFISEMHLDRFFSIFDKLLKEVEKVYSNKGEQSNRPPEVYKTLLLIAAIQHESWKEGKSNELFNRELMKRIDTLIDLLNNVPSEIGNNIFRILSITGIDEAREGFKKMVHSNIYTSEQLVGHAHACYIRDNDIDQLIKDLSRWKKQGVNPSTKETINEILDAVSNIS